MRAIRDLLAILLMLVMVVFPAAVSASQSHALVAASQDHPEHHHSMAGMDAASHLQQILNISHDGRQCHHAGHGSDNGCLGACCYVLFDAPAYGFPLRAWFHKTVLALPSIAKADDSSFGLPERPPRPL